MFGKILGFATMMLDCNLKGTDIRLPGFVFLRGKAVAIMVVINKTLLALTYQFRVPIGRYLTESVAGMVDEEGNFFGVAAKELEEEMGIKINEK